MRTTGLQYICRASNPLEEHVSQKIVVTGTNKDFKTVPRKYALFFHRLSILERATDHGCINNCNHPKEMWVGLKCNGLVNFFSERRYFKCNTCVFPPCPPPPHQASSPLLGTPPPKLCCSRGGDISDFKAPTGAFSLHKGGPLDMTGWIRHI